MSKLIKFNACECVTPEALNVKPDLLGMPLATPSRRALAIGLDVVAIALISSLASFWLPAAIAAVLYQLRKKPKHISSKPSAWLWFALLILATISSVKLVNYLEDNYQSKTGNPSQAQAVDEALAKVNLIIAANTTNTESNPTLEADPETLPEETDAARIATLESELALARMPYALKWREQLMKNLASLGLHFGWAIAYFSLLPYWWNGQSLGKRVFGLRVVELTGKPMRPMQNLSRYGGYAAGMATGGIGFLQVLWDVNRQAIQDKIAHTVVIDLRRPRRLDLLETHLNEQSTAEQTRDATPG